MTRMYQNKCTGVIHPISGYKVGPSSSKKPQPNNLAKNQQKIITALNLLMAADLEENASSSNTLLKNCSATCKERTQQCGWRIPI